MRLGGFWLALDAPGCGPHHLLEQFQLVRLLLKSGNFRWSRARPVGRRGAFYHEWLAKSQGKARRVTPVERKQSWPRHAPIWTAMRPRRCALKRVTPCA